MSVRLYFTNATTGYTPTTKRGAWDDSAGTTIKKLGLAPSGAAATVAVAETSTTNNYDVLLGRWVSDPIVNAKTISGNVSWVIGLKESNAAANMMVHVHVYVTTGDSDTVRGTLLADSVGTTELPTTAAGTTEGTKAVTSTAVSVGDRIVVEVGYQSQNTSATSYTGTMNYGNTGTNDLAAAATTVTTRPGYIEFDTEGLFTNKMHTLVDDFNDNSLSTAKWYKDEFNSTISETSNQLQLLNATAVDSYSYLYSSDGGGLTGYYSLYGSGAFVKVVDVPSQPTGYELYVLELCKNSANTVNWLISGGYIQAYKKINGTYTNLGTNAVYSAASHVYFRIRESAGTIYWDYSADGITWTNHTTLANPWPLDTIYASIATGNYQVLGATVLAKVDDFNVLTTTKTQTGKANIAAGDTITSRTQTGVARITKTTGQTQTGVSRIQKTVTQTQTGKSRITKVVPQTQTGKGRVTVTVPRTQTGVSRVTATTTRTQTGKGNIIITGTTQRPITGVSRVTKPVQQAQTGKASIKATTTRTQTGKGRVTNVTQRNQTGKGNIKAPVQRTTTGTATITSGVIASNKPGGFNYEKFNAYQFNSRDYSGSSITATPRNQTGKGAVLNTVGAMIFHDSFDDGLTGALWNNSFGSNITETGGAVQITSSLTPAYYWQSTAIGYDFTRGVVTSRIGVVGGQSLVSYEFIPVQVTLDSNNSHYISISNSQIRGVSNVGGVKTVGAAIAYTSAIKYVRIRELLGTVYFEYSTNGFEWNLLSSYAASFSLIDVLIEMVAGTWSSESSTAVSSVDEIWLGRDVANHQPGVSRITRSTTKTQTGTANITLTSSTTRSQTGKGFIKAPTTRTQTGKAYIAEQTVFVGKRFEYKVYDSDGNYIEAWQDVISDFSYSQEINSAGSDVEIILARPADNFGENVSVKFNNEVKVYVYDQDTPSGLLLFDGFIANYTPVFGQNEHVKVTLMGYGLELDKYIIQSGESSHLEQTTKNETLMFSSNVNYYNIGQVFRATATASINRMELGISLYDVASFPNAVVSLSLYSGATPGSGTLLGTATAAIDSTTTLANFVFPSAISVTNASDYWYEVHTTTYGELGPTPCKIDANSTSVYANGSVWTKTLAGSWTAVSGKDLWFKIYQTTGSTTATYSSQDPSDILRSLIDDYRLRGGKLNYDVSSIDDTGTTVTYTFNTNTTYEGIQKCLQLAPVDWYWYVDQATNLVHFHHKDSTIHHKFLLDRHISSMEIEKRTEDIINCVHFTGGETSPGVNLYLKRTRDASITAYGMRAIKMSDNRVTVTATANTMISTVLDTRSGIELRVDCQIIDNIFDPARGYDIESITLGQEIVFGGEGFSGDGSSLWDVMEWDADYWDFDFTSLSTLVLQITKLSYNGDKLGLSMSTVPPDVNKRIEDINRNLESEQTINNPSIPS